MRKYLRPRRSRTNLSPDDELMDHRRILSGGPDCHFVTARAGAQHDGLEIAIACGETVFAIAALAQDEAFHTPAASEDDFRDFTRI